MGTVPITDPLQTVHSHSYACLVCIVNSVYNKKDYLNLKKGEMTSYKITKFLIYSSRLSICSCACLVHVFCETNEASNNKLCLLLCSIMH